MVSRFTRAIVLVLVVAALSGSAFAAPTTKQLATGVSLYQDVNTTAGSELVVSSVTVDPKAAGVSVKAALGQDRTYRNWENIGDLTARRGALVGINADFFSFTTGDPQGVCIIDGELVSEPNRRAAMGLSKDGSVIFDVITLDAKLTLASGVSQPIGGIDRECGDNQLIVQTSACGPKARSIKPGTEIVLASDDLPVKIGKTISASVTEVHTNSAGTPIPKAGMVLSACGTPETFLAGLKVGDKLTIKFDVKSSNGADWTTVEQAVSGGPFLVKDGKTFVDIAAEGMGAAFSSDRHPRSALGATADGKLLIVTVDGRQPGISRGTNLPDLAELMKKLGARNAINLDGGGSTTLSYRGMIVNSPSGGALRGVVDGLLVFASPSAADEIPKLTITGPPSGVPIGQGAQLSACCGDDSHAVAADQLDHIVWGTAKGTGFINQQGYMIPNSLKRQSVRVMHGVQSADLSIVVVAGPPAKLIAKLVPDGKDAMLSRVSVTLSDIDNNPCTAKPIALTVTGGKADTPTGSTDDKGRFSAAITWDAGVTEHSVTATSGSLTTTAAPVIAPPAPVTAPAPVATPAPVTAPSPADSSP